MDIDMNHLVLCPNCYRYGIYADKSADITTTQICFKCKRAFKINWKTMQASPSEKIKNISMVR